MMKRIEVLMFDGCPHVDATVARASAAARAAGIPADVTVVRIASEEEAIRERFLGSPTVRVDGIDIDPAVAAGTDFGLQCRLYTVDGQLQGTPPDEWIVLALGGSAPLLVVTSFLGDGSVASPCCTGRKD
ncbi:hypothetical protein LVJ94_33595 [Pendulispora rubella]|uniref:Alkylmercury lyase n=1 Tax=Pendulispora rubella TaxID=2741070 RepID=A0ABZ2KUT0_9BACT